MKEKSMSKARITLTPVVPAVPEALSIEEGRLPGMPETLPLSAFPEAALRRVGRAWTEALVKARQGVVNE